MEKIYAWVLKKTEDYWTRRRARRIAEKASRTALTELWGWADALLFAVVFVFLLNQFFIQLFVIPSPSMVGTLEVKDRVLVNKQAYGVEVYPGGPKILARRTPDRDDIITFYNPDYQSRGPVFDILSQCLYMATLSFVNIDRDEEGNPREKLYVKRAVGMGGDRVAFRDGNVLIRPAGTDSWTTEEEFRAQAGLQSGPHRSLEPDVYPALKARAASMAYADAGVAQGGVPAWMLAARKPLESSSRYFDMLAHQAAYAGAAFQLDPSDLSKRSAAAAYERGIYVPRGRVLPLGDNRDNSSDGRYFGPVPIEKINGRVNATIWPFGHWRSFV